MLDLDYRPMFWASRRGRRGRWVREALPHATVAVGNQEESRSRSATRSRGAAALLELGASWRSSSRGRRACSPHAGRAVEVPPVPVEVVNGLGAGDAFGGALCHGLLRLGRRAHDALRQRQQSALRLPA